MLESIAASPALRLIFNLVGLGSIAACAWLAVRTQGLLGEWRPVLFSILAYAGGASFYFLMPFFSATNPPMNWGYASTWDGFVHAFTRGQYEKTNPSLEVGRLLDQVLMLFEGAVEEFNLAYLLVALVPLLYWGQMRRRERPAEQGLGPERAWFAGLAAIYVCLAFLLLWLLNPSPDRQSRALTKVFFTASHVIISMSFGYGLALIAGLCARRHAEFRRVGQWAAAIAVGMALFVVLVTFGIFELFPPEEPHSFFGIAPTQDVLVRFTTLLALGLALAALVIFSLPREHAPMPALLALFALLPLKPTLSHWADNEQRGHLFGWWFGHDMFTPPFTGAEGGPLYPEMARHAILFGGTDPGRFNPTYMIFSESFLPPRCKPRDPDFDRRDVYLITQNALADGTYLNYIRAHYNRSAQVDPPFFQEMLRSRREREKGLYTNWLARAVAPLDRLKDSFGRAVEARRRARGVYPPVEIHTPSAEDSIRAYDEYMRDAWQRKQTGQLRPGEDVLEQNGRVTVSGQTAVMAINGLLCRTIFDQNPTNEFYIEESFPLDWMYPHLTPFGVIMKINREPLETFTEDLYQRDREFWRRYSERLIGDWITPETPVQEIADFVERVFVQGDLRGFQGDRKFLRDDNAQKAFSKLRSAIAGVYAWRLQNLARSPAEQQRLATEADFAFKQAFAYCPYSPEAVFRYANLLVSLGRFDDAMLISRAAQKLDPYNTALASLISQLADMQRQRPEIEKARAELQQREERFRTNPADADTALALASTYLAMQQPAAATNVLGQLAAALEPRVQAEPTNTRQATYLAAAYVQLRQPEQAARVLDLILAQPNLSTDLLLSVAQSYAQLGHAGRLEAVLKQLTQRMPDSPEAFYDYAGVAASLGKLPEARQALEEALRLSDARRRRDPAAKDLRGVAATDPRLQPLRAPGAP
jgi:tetratricopeptide (TPR) repeat protein